MSGSWGSYPNQGAYFQGYQAGHQPQQGYSPAQQQYQYSQPQPQRFQPSGPPQAQGYRPPGPPHIYQTAGSPQPQGYQATGPYQYSGYQQPQPYQHQAPGPYSYQQYQQAFQPRPFQHKVAQPSPETCYNCGSPEHWAQNCPEAKREVPHGSMCESSRVQKRWRPNYIPPVITKYQVASQVQSSYISFKNYVPPPNDSPSFPPNSRPYASAPNTTHSPPYPQQQWKGPYPPATPSQAPPTYGGAVPPSPYGSGPNSAQHGSPYQKPVPGQLKGPFTPPYGPESQTRIQRESSVSSAGYLSSAALPPTANQNQPIALKRDVSIDKSMLLDSSKEDEIEPDDLSLLDVPDLPQEIANIVGSKRPQLSGRPLSTAFDSEDLTSLPPPSFDSDGNTRSRFVNVDTIDLLLGNIKDSKDFETRKDDPIFLLNVKHFEHAKAEQRSPVSEHYSNVLDTSNNSPAHYGTPHTDSKLNPDQGDGLSRTPVYKPESSESPNACDAFDPNSPGYDKKMDVDAQARHPRHDPNALPSRPLPLKTQGSRSFNGHVQASSPSSNPGRKHSLQISLPYGSSNGHTMYGDKNQTSPSNKSNDRKRKHESDEYDEGRSDERRRQDDDVLPKHKRNQPKVAEAYSRRW